jgi:hypothetical protein
MEKKRVHKLGLPLEEFAKLGERLASFYQVLGVIFVPKPRYQRISAMCKKYLTQVATFASIRKILGQKPSPCPLPTGEGEIV